MYLTTYGGYAEAGKNAGDQSKLVRHLVCLDRKTGVVRWTKDIPAVLPESAYKPGTNDGEHGYASSTPASDGKHIFAFFGKTGVFCFDLKGEKVWSKSVGDKTEGWGSASSPLLHDDLVIVNAGVESSSLVALKKSDGQEAWRLPGTKKCWGSPILVEVPGGKPEVVLSLAGKPGKIVSIDPVSGKELWSCEGNGDGYICPSVVYHDGIVYAVAGRTNHAVAVKAGGMGEVKPLWTAKASLRVGSPVYHDGYLYGLSEQAPSAIFCLEAATGKVMYSERINLNGHAYASAVYADGKIFYVREDATTYVVAAKPKYELLATNKLADTSRTNASPIIDNGRLLIRTDEHLYCIGKK